MSMTLACALTELRPGWEFAIDGDSYDGVVWGKTLDDGHAIPTAAEVTAKMLDDPAPKVPVSVTMRQARMALLNAGLLNAVNAAIAAIPGASGDAARIEWEFSSEVQRNRPLLSGLAQALGLSEAQIDQLFITAAML